MRCSLLPRLLYNQVFVLMCSLLPFGLMAQTANEVKEFVEPGIRPLNLESASWIGFVSALTNDNPKTWPSYLEATDFDAALRNGIGRTMLHYTAMQGNLKASQELLRAGVNANSIDSLYGHTALHEAATKGFTDIAQALVAAGARVNARGRDGSTPLHLAAGTEHPATVAYLLKAGANVNSRDKENITPLHCAIAASNREIAQQLIDAGALPDSKSLDTWDMAGDTTPLHMAASQGNLELVILLVEHAATLNLTNRDGQTALNMAHAGRHNQVVAYLQNKGAKY